MRSIVERRPGLGRIQFEELGYVCVGPKPDLPVGTKLVWYCDCGGLVAVYDVKVEWSANVEEGCKVSFLEPGPDGAAPGDVFEAHLFDLFWHPPEDAKPMKVFEPMVLERNIHCDRGCNNGVTRSRFLCVCVRVRP